MITIDPAGGEGVNSHIEKTRVFVVSFRGQESSFGTFSPIGKRIYCSCHATWLLCKTSIPGIWTWSIECS